MIKTLLITTLEKLGYPVYLQNSMDEDEEYPASFITFIAMTRRVLITARLRGAGSFKSFSIVPIRSSL